VGPAPHRPEQLRGRVFRGSFAVETGRLTRNQLRSTAWRRLYRDVYACATVEVTHRVRATAASLAVRGSVVSGRSAAVLWGVDAAGPEDDVELTVSPTSSTSALPGIRVRRRALPPAHVIRHFRVPLTTGDATAVDLAGRLERADAVVLVDQLIVAGAADLDRVRDLAASSAGRYSARARVAVALADGLAGSPQETRLRLLLHSSLLPRPVAQYKIFDADGRFVARVDFAWPELRLALEYDGVWHGEPQQVGKDRARLNRLTACGWRVVFVTAADLRDPVALLARIAAALAA
jgi:hypothetical protein